MSACMAVDHITERTGRKFGIRYLPNKYAYAEVKYPITGPTNLQTSATSYSRENLKID
jgi:hypothetical protein